MVFRRRHLARLLVLALLGGGTVVITSTVAAAAPITRVVHDAAAYRDAITDLAADDTGPHRIVLAADIDVGAAEVPVYESSRPLTVEGRGHTLRGAEGGYLLRGGQGTTLTVADLTVTGRRAAFSWGGVIVVRDSRFAQVGRGGSPGGPGSVLEANQRNGVPGLVLVTDTLFEDDVVSGSLIRSTNKVTATRVTFRQNTARGSLVYGRGRVRLVDTRVVGNLVPASSVIQSYAEDIELVGTDVIRNRRSVNSGSPTVWAYGDVHLTRSRILDNDTAGTDLSLRVAVNAHRIVARSSVIRHAHRACWVESGALQDTLVSDATCIHRHP